MYSAPSLRSISFLSDGKYGSCFFLVVMDTGLEIYPRIQYLSFSKRYKIKLIFLLVFFTKTDTKRAGTKTGRILW